MHVATGAGEILHHLNAGLAGADDQHAALGELIDVAVIDRMHLHDLGRQGAGVVGFNRRVIAARRDHHLIANPCADAGLDTEPARRLGRDAGHVHMFAQIGFECLDKGIKVLGDLIAQHEPIGIGTAIFGVIMEARQPTLPVRRHKAKAVPAVHAPRMEFLVPFKDDRLDTLFLQAFGGG